MIADAMATTIDVLGPDEGYKFAEREKLPVFLIVKDERGYREIVNNRMKKYFRKLKKEK
jgi:thiamine biosynthesis lipoprotein